MGLCPIAFENSKLNYKIRLSLVLAFIVVAFVNIHKSLNADNLSACVSEKREHLEIKTDILDCILMFVSFKNIETQIDVISIIPIEYSDIEIYSSSVDSISEKIFSKYDDHIFVYYDTKKNITANKEFITSSVFSYRYYISDGDSKIGNLDRSYYHDSKITICLMSVRSSGDASFFVQNVNNLEKEKKCFSKLLKKYLSITIGEISGEQK